MGPKTTTAVAILALSCAAWSATGLECKYTGCHTNGNGVCENDFGNEWYGTGTYAYSAWVGDWDFCFWFYQEHYECCKYTPAPTKAPTKKPTQKPTPFPTPAPTQAPTPKPTRFPSESPTRSPTKSPTKFPTMYPTLLPRTPAPSFAPTELGTSCSAQDENIWDEMLLSRSQFDSSMAACALYCGLDIFTERLTAVECVRSCWLLTGSQRPKVMPDSLFSRNCAYCFGTWAACMLDDCNCPSGRTLSATCQQCSASKCEPRFTTCTGGFVIPATTETESVAPIEASSIVTLTLGIAGGLVAFGLASSGVVYIRRKRRAARTNPAEALEAKLKAAAGATVITPRFSEAVSSNPHFSSTAEPPALPDAAIVSAEAVPEVIVLSEPQMLTVMYEFTGEYDDELSVAEGLEIEGLRIVGEWWWCRDPASGKEGLVPSVNLAPI